PARSPRAGFQGDHRGGGRPSNLFRVREAVVPPEVFVRRTHDSAQRTRAAARPDRRRVADRLGTTRRTEAVRDQGGPGHDLEEQDTGTDRDRRPSTISWSASMASAASTTRNHQKTFWATSS